LIREPLAFDPFERSLSAASIVNAKGFPIVVSEIEIGKIAPQVFLGNVLINSVHAALEDAEEAFNHVRVNRPAHVLFLLVLDGAMRSEVMADARIDRVLVTHEIAIAFDVARQDAAQTVCRDRGDLEGTDLATSTNTGIFSAGGRKALLDALRPM